MSTTDQSPGGADPRLNPPTPDALSVRERQVVTLIAHGYSNQQIAEELFLSINSVKTYVRSAYRRIGASRRSQAVVWGLTHGLK